MQTHSHPEDLSADVGDPLLLQRVPFGVFDQIRHRAGTAELHHQLYKTHTHKQCYYTSYFRGCMCTCISSVIICYLQCQRARTNQKKKNQPQTWYRLLEINSHGSKNRNWVVKSLQPTVVESKMCTSETRAILWICEGRVFELKQGVTSLFKLQTHVRTHSWSSIPGGFFLMKAP